MGSGVAGVVLEDMLPEQPTEPDELEGPQSMGNIVGALFVVVVVVAVVVVVV